MLMLTILFSLTVILQWPIDSSSVSSGKSIEVFRVFGYGLLAGVIFKIRFSSYIHRQRKE